MQSRAKKLAAPLDESDVTFAALMQPHWLQTRREMQERSVILLIQDTTELDLTHRHKMSGIGQIGDKKGRGLLLQTVLAVVVLATWDICSRKSKCYTGIRSHLPYLEMHHQER
ncbi:hypothetical protein [Ktedonobacter racemifer]|uniref:Transposase IS4 family protein n=1 Tax=Ktedonobacter racemifer DSM 44963 TaxID=485913 RepID=D6TWU8_KTERA|nr:hypothetical protein [Ktedonobacter racemifer]EFH84681.1 hypothetical protein Krac_5780 [Ktedonobacter racemifer DSM 44963]